MRAEGEPMTGPKRLRLSRAKGWRLPDGAVRVDRATPWGNPFIVGQDGTAAECVRLHGLLLGGLVCVSSRAAPEQQESAREHVLQNIDKLRGRDLACWCALTAPCHADTLLWLANHAGLREET